MKKLFLLFLLPVMALAATPRLGNLSEKTLHVKRTALTAQEHAKTFPFQVVLPMRNLAELQARVGKGEVISQAEMDARYYPTTDEYSKVRNWLNATGVATIKEDPTHLTVFAESSVATVAHALSTEFAVVTDENEKEFISATQEPVIPEDLRSHILAINGLQPHIHMHPRLTASSPQVLGQSSLSPRLLGQYYQIDQTALTGAGQTIIVMGTQLNTNDLTQFWAACNVPQTLNNFTVIHPTSAWLTPDSTKNAGNDLNVAETTMDVEWASGMAPGAKIELFQSLDWGQVTTEIANEIRAGNTSIHQLTSSWGSAETDLSANALTSYGQYFLTITASGVTIFNASGDSGSSTTNAKGVASISVSWPASDPSVIGVGGTSTDLGNPNDLNSLVEHGWPGSGGGISSLARPFWQVGAGVPAGTQRCVPDVAAPAWGNYLPAIVVFNGQATGYGGTSLSSPTWAGMCALLNESRASFGMPALGLLGPKIYPLLGSAAFNDIADNTSDGTYNAGVGYDMVTGLGTPNIPTLARALTLGISSGNSHLGNISSRTFVGTGSGVQIAGFIITGSESKTVLIRVNGPALAAYGVTDYLAAPTLSIYSGSQLIASNAGWGNTSTINGASVSNTALVASTAQSMGVAAWPAQSADSALVLTLPPGGYTAIVQGVNNTTGVALAEVYDAGPNQNSHLANISTRSLVETGDKVQIAGFIITGTGPRTVLIRANGPALKAFGINDFVPNPQLNIYSGSNVIGANTTGWGGTPQLTQVGSIVGVTTWPTDSKDAAIVMTLQPGGYTAIVTDANGVTGNALVEVYEVNN